MTKLIFLASVLIVIVTLMVVMGHDNFVKEVGTVVTDFAIGAIFVLLFLC